MSNGADREKVNVDELVDFLIKRRQGVVPDDEVPVSSAQAESNVRPEPEVASQPEPVAVEPEKIPMAEEIPAQDQPSEPEPAPETVLFMESEETVPAQPAKKKKRFSLFGRRKQEVEETDDDWDDWGLTPLGSRTEEPEEPTVPPVAEEESSTPQPLDMDELPAVKAVAETITMQVVLPSGEAVPSADPATRVIPVVEEKAAPAASQKDDSNTVVVTPSTPEEDDDDDQLPDQLSLEEMVRVEDIEPAEGMEDANADEDPQARLQRSREEKVREFVLGGGEEETNEPDEEVVAPTDAEEPEVTDFTGYQDTKAVATELRYRQRTALMTLLFTGLLAIVLLLFTVLTVVAEVPPFSVVGYLAIHAFALALMMAINYTAVGRGLSGLFTLRANSDTAPAVASVVTLLSVLLHFIDTSAALPYWSPLAGLLLVFSAAGHYARAVGIRRNFSFVSYPGEKYAATLIEEENAVQEIGRRASGAADGKVAVGYFHRTGFLTNFLTNAYEDHRGDDWSRWMTPIAIGLSFGLSFVSLWSEAPSFWKWLSVFVGMLCVSMQATHLAVQLPLNQCSRVMLSRGGFLVGWKAVRDFGELDALVVDMADLYPDESMLLHGIKTFGGTHIDDAILTAASLVVRAGGPLAKIFRRIIENKEELLFDVDSLVYEQGMGLSGWVDGRRVFVGNRRLLQNHGVDVPSMDYEARYAKDGRRLVYLSVAGQLSAMYVVSYLPDPEIQDALQDLCHSHVTLLVRSCDPNITTVELCSDFALDEYYVDVLPAAAGRAYMQLAERASDRMPAVMASNGHILGTAWALSVCRSLRAKSLIALVVQALAAAIGLLLCLVWTLNNSLMLFQPLLFMLGSSLLTWIVPLFKRT